MSTNPFQRPDPEDIRHFAATVGRMTGRDDLTQDILSGRMGAEDVAPMLAGMVDMAIKTFFAPTVGIRDYEEFDPTARPLVGRITMLDGSVLRVTLEAE